MSDFLSAFRVFLAPGLTLTYHRLKSAKTPERERWRRAGCAPRAQRQLHSQRSVRGAPQQPQFAAAAGLTRIIEESARKPHGARLANPAIPLACGGTYEHPGLAPYRLGVPKLPMQPSNSTSRALSDHTRYRRFGAQIGRSAVEPSSRSNFANSFSKRIPTKPRVIRTTTVPTTLPGVLHALGIVRYLHNQNEISKVGG